MPRTPLTVFVCTHKHCRKVWRRLPRGGSHGPDLESLAQEAGLEVRLQVVETECMDRCDDGGCLFLAGPAGARWVTGLDDRHGCARLQSALRCAVQATVEPTGAVGPPLPLREHVVPALHE
ncbi:MAG TPA: hypothetical protein PKD86_09575 [Gemmatales bacterium]|nr:hypothetical protein [Gemmatales bacterium]HMP59590.1 hypothetical protein [Gemmatales bacterium]